jgi:nitrogenase iron protein NifH
MPTNTVTANNIDQNEIFVIPAPLKQERLEALLMEHGIVDV